MRTGSFRLLMSDVLNTLLERYRFIVGILNHSFLASSAAGGTGFLYAFLIFFIASRSF